MVQTRDPLTIEITIGRPVPMPLQCTINSCYCRVGMDPFVDEEHEECRRAGYRRPVTTLEKINKLKICFVQITETHVNVIFYIQSEQRERERNTPNEEM